MVYRAGNVVCQTISQGFTDACELLKLHAVTQQEGKLVFHFKLSPVLDMQFFGPIICFRHEQSQSHDKCLNNSVEWECARNGVESWLMCQRDRCHSHHPSQSRLNAGSRGLPCFSIGDWQKMRQTFVMPTWTYDVCCALPKLIVFVEFFAVFERNIQWPYVYYYAKQILLKWQPCPASALHVSPHQSFSFKFSKTLICRV